MKRIGIAAVVALSFLGCVLLWNVGWQVREDYQNFRRIVQWVAIKQQQEQEYLKRQQAQRAQAPAPTTGTEAAK